MTTKKKPAPTPLPCICGRAPVVVKVRGAGYMVACSNVKSCTNRTTYWPTEGQAVEKWDELTRSLIYKEANR